MSLFSIISFPSPAFAHSVETNYQLRANELEIKLTFSTGEAFENAAVVVRPPSELGLEPIKGQTNEQGIFIFQPDYSIPGNWSVEIGEGSHWDFLNIPVSNQSINFEAISQNHLDRPHHHYFADAILGVEVALCFGIFGQFIKAKLKP
ncbi:MAG: hypothetical protein HC916_16675 [Coleofasciculaceae cyanobacterium SM2_1_6]|nr:hypothetical protein [Coleofasciculaceae cyanobacterium SM2_1_6]